jgi:hypothetical protein
VVYDDLVRQGKLRYVALSNHPAWQVTQALWIADDRHLAAAPVCAQVKYNLIDRAAEDELAPACQQFGLSIVPFGPLHGGLLAGMQVEEREFSGDKRFGGSGFTDTELEIGRAALAADRHHLPERRKPLDRRADGNGHADLGWCLVWVVATVVGKHLAGQSRSQRLQQSDGGGRRRGDRDLAGDAGLRDDRDRRGDHDHLGAGRGVLADPSGRRLRQSRAEVPAANH